MYVGQCLARAAGPNRRHYGVRVAADTAGEFPKGGVLTHHVPWWSDSTQNVLVGKMTKSGKVLSAIVLSVALNGCAQSVWLKPGASQQDFASDRYSCERDVRQSGYYGTGLMGAINMENFFNQCMGAHGWSLHEVASPSSSSSSSGPRPPHTEKCRPTCLKQDDKFKCVEEKIICY